MTDPTAHLERDPTTGELVLVDPEAYAMIKAVAQRNCRITFDTNADRITHFRERIAALGRSPDDVVIVVINVDTQIGRPLADALMPGTNWQAIRDAGQEPFARGLAARDGVHEYLTLVDKDEANKLRHAPGRVVAVIIDYDVVACFDVACQAPLRVREPPC